MAFDFEFGPAGLLGMSLLAGAGGQVGGLGEGLLKGVMLNEQLADRRAQKQMREQQLSAEMRKQQLAHQLQDYIGSGSADARGILARGGTPEMARAYAEAPNMGRAKVSNYKQMRLPGGQVVEVPMNEFGEVGGPSFTPYIDPKILNLGNRQALLDPAAGEVTKSFDIGIDPGTIYSQQMQNARTAMSEARQDARSAAAASREKTPVPIFKEGVGWITPPVGLGPGEAYMPPGMEPPKGSAEAMRRGAERTMPLLNDAEDLVKKSTGSGVGALRDIGVGFFGGSTDASKAAGQLKVISSALIMNMPRLEGPQSDRDTQLYKEAAASIGDPWTPEGVKQDALKTVKKIQNMYRFGEYAENPKAPPQPRPARALSMELMGSRQQPAAQPPTQPRPTGGGLTPGMRLPGGGIVLGPED